MSEIGLHAAALSVCLFVYISVCLCLTLCVSCLCESVCLLIYFSISLRLFLCPPPSPLPPSLTPSPLPFSLKLFVYTTSGILGYQQAPLLFESPSHTSTIKSHQFLTAPSSWNYFPLCSAPNLVAGAQWHEIWAASKGMSLVRTL